MTRKDDIQDNKLEKVFEHIAKTNCELGKVQTDVEWLKKFFFIVATASVGSLVAGVINILIK